MSEKIEPVEDSKPDNNVRDSRTANTEEREFTSLEKKMINHGWSPDGELSAEDWIDNGFKVKNKKLDRVFDTVEKLKEKIVEQETSAYKKAKEDLEARRVMAIEEADLETVKNIEQQKQALVDPSVKEYADAFIKKHSSWIKGSSYEEQEMARMCRQRDLELASEGLHPEEHFMKLEKYLVGKYKDYFSSGKEPIANAVEGKQPSIIKAQTKKFSFENLDDMQKSAARNLAKQGIMTIDEYVKQIQKMENK